MEKTWQSGQDSPFSSSKVRGTAGALDEDDQGQGDVFVRSGLGQEEMDPSVQRVDCRVASERLALDEIADGHFSGGV